MTSDKETAPDAVSPDAERQDEERPTHGNGMGFALGAGQFGQPGGMDENDDERAPRDGEQLGQPGTMPAEDENRGRQFGEPGPRVV
ncbi:hypothetical protein [Falsarthrobacter nasiphocae]|uniref:Uncharacterized protein n=1 Tax=Falsarthrobacter nasiphocae TaxID=189863 RepID=A0AAE3YE02_9MICC|nr:hypothetical protein [Falsarthrobacter nasiphocae]MDR6892113.1 hypothetical protein [Falsarthrobacter nasiphocae]